MIKRLQSFIPALGIFLWLGIVMVSDRHDGAFYLVTAMFSAFVSASAFMKVGHAVDAKNG